MSRPEKKWEFLPLKEVEKGEEMPVIISALLAQRGITSPAAVDSFLNPSFEQLPSPEGMLGLHEAVDILEDALAGQDPVVIFGDYDADGITSTAVLSLFFLEIGLSATSYIPDRLGEGYGLNSEAVQRLRSCPEVIDAEKPVLVTVDCGISNHLEIAEARKLGFRVIVTDHHQPTDELPEADAILNPHQKKCLFPYNELAGVGVAFYLIAGLRARLSAQGFWPKGAQPNLKKYLDLVAIGTVADMVPLTGANRILVRAGLEVMKESPRPGICSLMKKAGISVEGLDSSSIGYLLGPRINAAGRVGDPKLAIQLLIADDREETDKLADKLEGANDLRKELAEKIFQEASLQAGEQVESGNKALMLTGENWHLGVIGLVASRIANIYYRPTVVMSWGEEGLVRGSIRSIDDLDILQVLNECSNLLERFGGHKAAAGLSIKRSNVKEFSRKFESSVDRLIGDKDLAPTIQLNYKASIGGLFGNEFLDFYRKMEPFGKGNPEPLFSIEGDTVKLVDARKIGKDSLRFRVNQNDNSYNGVAFGMAHMLESIQEGPVEMAFRIVRNDFRGVVNWEIRAEDIRAAGLTS